MTIVGVVNQLNEMTQELGKTVEPLKNDSKLKGIVEQIRDMENEAFESCGIPIQKIRPQSDERKMISFWAGPCNYKEIMKAMEKIADDIK